MPSNVFKAPQAAKPPWSDGDKSPHSKVLRTPPLHILVPRLPMLPLLVLGCIVIFNKPNASAATAMIMAGDENALPTDTPSMRGDPLGPDSAFAFVGALSIQAGGSSYRGTGCILSPHWVLTAGHNVDLDNNGQADSMLGITFHLQGTSQTWTASGFYPHPLFTGFSNPTVQHDLALLYFTDPLPPQTAYAILGTTPPIGAEITLAGYGRSGYGNYGYTTTASLTDRRTGENVIESLDSGGGAAPLLFRYSFSAHGSPGSLGNDRESIIGPGDSGGPMLAWQEGGWRIAGVNTFAEGYGGRFGDTGGGVLVAPYRDWILSTTSIPEPGVPCFLIVLGVTLVRRRPVIGGPDNLIPALAVVPDAAGFAAFEGAAAGEDCFQEPAEVMPGLMSSIRTVSPWGVPRNTASRPSRLPAPPAASPKCI